MYLYSVRWLGKGKTRLRFFENREDAERFASRLDSPGVSIRSHEATKVEA